MNTRRRIDFVILIVGFLFGFVGGASGAMGPLKVHPVNPRYFADSENQVVYLTGSHTWAAFQERGIEGETTNFDYPAFLDFLVSHHHNFLRLWTWEHATWMQFCEKETRIRYTPLCYMRTGPGKAIDGEPRFDVTQFNPIFFERLRDRVFAAREKGIYVGVMLFQGFSVEQKGQKEIDPKMGNPWDGHPFNAKNNINRIDGDLNGDGEGEEVHTLANAQITQIQEAYVKKVIDTLNGFDNIIWEIGNECSGLSTDWQYHMIRLIKEYEKTKPYQHPVWMTYQWSAHTPGTNQALFESPADAVSPNEEGGFDDDPPDMQGKKVVISDTDHIDPTLKTIDHTWAWKSFFRGLNPIVMDPYRDVRVDSPEKPVEEFEPIRKAMGQSLLFANNITMATMTPHPELASTGFCLADPGQEYLVYQPQSEKLFWVDLPAGTYRVELFSPREGVIKTSIGLQSTEQKKQIIPIFFYGDVVVFITKVEVPPSDNPSSASPPKNP